MYDHNCDCYYTHAVTVFALKSKTYSDILFIFEFEGHGGKGVCILSFKCKHSLAGSKICACLRVV
jgi:hypothetical protein